MSMSVSTSRDLEAYKNTDRKIETDRKMDRKMNRKMERDKDRTRTETRIRMGATSADETRLSVSPEGYQVNEATNCILCR
jgi:hypothetical protein